MVTCTTGTVDWTWVVHVTMGSTTTNYYDTGQISNTHGVDMAGCPYTGTRNDESQVWTRIYTQAPLASGSREAQEGESAAPVSRRFYLGPAFPNPAGAELTLRYVIPTRQDVEIAIYDVSGRQVQTHLNRDLDPGEYQSVIDISGIPVGMYYCTLRAGDRVLHQRFAHVR